MAINILFTCAGRRNYLVNYFKDSLEGRGKIFAADMTLSAPAMVDADVALLVPNFYDKNYIACLKVLIAEYEIKAIVSLNDLELPILAKHKKELEALGVKVIISDENVIDIAFDKYKTHNFLSKNGLLSPKTFTNLNEATNAINKGLLNFPLVVKPRWGSSSIGIDFPENLEELQLTFKLQHLKLKRSILNIASEHDFENAIIIQEKIVGTEYGLDVLNDFNGNYVGTFVKEKLSMRSGETDKAISRIDARLENLGKTISKQLKHIATLDCDVIINSENLYVLELNPRFGGGYPFSHEAGAHISSMYVAWLLGERDVSKFNNYKSDLAFSKCDRMIKIPNI